MIFLLIWIALQIIVEMLPVSSSGHITLLQMMYSKYAHCNLEDYFSRKNISIQTIYYLLHIPTLLIISFWFARDWYYLFFSEFPHISWPPILWLVIADGITVLAYFFISKNMQQIWFLLRNLCPFVPMESLSERSESLGRVEGNELKKTSLLTFFHSRLRIYILRSNRTEKKTESIAVPAEALCEGWEANGFGRIREKK